MGQCLERPEGAIFGGPFALTKTPGLSPFTNDSLSPILIYCIRNEWWWGRRLKVGLGVLQVVTCRPLYHSLYFSYYYYSIPSWLIERAPTTTGKNYNPQIFIGKSETDNFVGP